MSNIRITLGRYLLLERVLLIVGYLFLPYFAGVIFTVSTIPLILIVGILENYQIPSIYSMVLPSIIFYFFSRQNDFIKERTHDIFVVLWVINIIIIIILTNISLDGNQGIWYIFTKSYFIKLLSMNIFIFVSMQYIFKVSGENDQFYQGLIVLYKFLYIAWIFFAFLPLLSEGP